MTTVAEGDIRIDLHDAGAIAELRALDAEFDRTMASMDRKKAEVKITGDISDLKRKLREAQALEKQHNADLKKLEKDRLALSGAQKGVATKRIKALQAEQAAVQNVIKSERQRLTGMEAGLRGLRAQNRELDTQARTAKAAESAQKRLNTTQKTGQDQRIVGTAQEEAAVAKLQKRYEALYLRKARLDRKPGSTRRALDPSLDAQVKFDKSVLAREMAGVEAELAAWGRKPVTKHVDLKIEDDAGRGAGLLGKWLRQLNDTSVRVGPFTTTIANLGKQLGQLGPIIVGLIAQLGALVGTLGAGLAGALGVATASVIGFGGAALGIFAIVKPLVKDFMDAKKATEALNKAQREHGKDSKEYAKKLEILKNVMGDIPDKTRQQFIALGGLNQRWKDLTASARPEFWKLTGEGIQTVSDLMPMFARNSVVAFKATSQGIQGWMKSLRSSSGQSVLNNIFGNFNKSIPNILGGLGDLGAAIGRIGQSFSRYLPSLTTGFKKWTDGLLGGTQRTDRLNTGTDKLVSAMRSVGHVTAAAGRVLTAFFGASVGPGTSMLESWATGLNNLAAGMRSVSGQRAIQGFFEDFIGTANKFWAALKPIAQIFFEWSTAMKPVTDAMLVAIKVVGQLVQAFVAFGPIKNLIQATFAVLITGALVGRIRAVTTAISGLARAMLGLKAAQVGTAAIGAQAVAAGAGARAAAGARGAIGTGAGVAAAGAGTARGAAVAGAAAGAAAGKVGKLAKAGNALKFVLTGIGAVLGGGLGLGIAAVAVGGLALAFHHFHSAAQKAHDSFDASGKSAVLAGRAYQAAGSALPDMVSQHLRANLAVKAAQKELKGAKKGTDEYKLAQLNLRDAQREQIRTGQEVSRVRREQDQASTTQVKNERNRLAQFDKAHKREMDILREQKANGGDRGAVAASRLNDLLAKRAPLADKVTAAENRMAAQQANMKRQTAGLLPILGAAEQKLGALARRSSKTAVKIATKFEDPKDAGRVAAKANAALKSGVSSRIVLKIVGDSKNAEDAIRRLNAAKITQKKLDIVEHGGNAAVAVIEKIIGRKLGKKEVAIAQHGGQAALGMLSVLAGKRIPPKKAVVSAIDNASGTIGGILGLLASIPATKTTRVITTHENRAPGAGHAKGRGPGGSERALVGEGRRGTGAPEAIADHKTGRIRMVTGPTVVDLKPTEAVIPTEPAFRAGGAKLLTEFAKDMGIPGFAKKRKPKKKGTKKAKHNYAPEKLKEVKEYRRLEDLEDTQSNKVDVLDRTVREPDELVKKIGVDAAGNDLYEIDTAEVGRYKGEMGNLITAQETLNATLQNLKKAFNPAIGALNKYRTEHKSNKKKLEDAIKADDKHADEKYLKGPNKGELTKRAKAARKRQASNKKKLEKEKTFLSQQADTREDLTTDNKDLRETRIPMADLDLRDQKFARDSIDPNAAEALTSANPKPEPPEQYMSYGGQKALTDTVLAGIAKEFGGNASPNVGAIPGASSPGGAQGLQTNPAAVGAAIGVGARSAALGSIVQGSGVAGVSGAATSGSAAGAASSTLVRSALVGSSGDSNIGIAGAGGTVKNVNITNHFKTQPSDPVTWTKGVEFEAGALL